MPSVNGPDFICIGMAKAGTSWLYDQLNGHPDFWMPRVKELQYLNHRVPKLPTVEKHLRQLNRATRRPRQGGPGTRGNDPRQHAFLRDAQALAGQPRDIDRYAGLFRQKGESLSGDISPPYVSLTEDVIRELSQRLPDVRILLLVREPLERVWSSLCMNYRRGHLDRALLEEPSRFEKHFEEERLDDRMFPTRILERWKRTAPQLRFRHVLFDDIAAAPEPVRREILGFLGADPDKESGDVPADFNRKANAEKLPLKPAIRGILLHHFADEMRACADVFGGAARSWAGRYGL